MFLGQINSPNTQYTCFCSKIEELEDDLETVQARANVIERHCEGLEDKLCKNIFKHSIHRIPSVLKNGHFSNFFLFYERLKI